MQKEYIDVAVIGAGPAGVQAAYYLKKQGVPYQVFEAGQRPGAFFEKYPVHRQLISINKVHTGYQCPELNLRWDWNSLLSEEYSPLFKSFSKEYFPPADEMVSYLGAFAQEHGLNIQFNSAISDIEKVEGFIEFECNGQRYQCQRLIVATGLSKEFLPRSIPGIELAVPYGEMSIEREDYANKRVLIIGKGNSAFETADHLIPSASMIHLCSGRPVQFAWKTHYVGHLRAVNNNFLDTYQLKSQNAVLDANIRGIRLLDDGTFEVTFEYLHAQGEVETIVYDVVLSCAGFSFNDRIFKHGHPLCEKEKYPVHDNRWQSSRYPGVYFAGTIMHYRDYRKYTSGFVHGFRYNVKRLVEEVCIQVKEGTTPESYLLTSDVNALSADILTRINQSSALWQQPGFLCNFYQLLSNGQAQLLPEQSKEYVESNVQENGLSGVAVTLEYGDPVDGDLFASERIHRENAQQADLSKFLHPILVGYHQGKIISKDHIIEDLFGEWNESIHRDQVVAAVTAFFNQVNRHAEDASYA